MTRIAIRTRTIILALIAALPLLLLAIYEVDEQRRQALEGARQDALLMARAQAEVQAAILNQTLQMLSGVAAAGFAFDDLARRKDCPVALKRVVDARAFHVNAVLADANGVVRCSVRPLVQAVNVADREYFRRAVSQRTHAVSGLITGRVSGAETIAAAYPVLGESGEVRSVLIAAVNAAKLADALRGASVKEGAVVMLVDLSGHVVASFPDGPPLDGKILPAIERSKGKVAAASHGFLEFAGADGAAHIGAFSRLPNAPEWPLYVLAGFPRAEIERAPRERLLRELATIVLVFVFALGIALVGAQRLLVSPLRRLGEAAERHYRGDLSARSGLDHGAGEIGTLAKTFDTLAAHSERVTRALKALSAGNRTLLREKQEDSLLAAMCRVAVAQAGYRLACVNYLRHDEAKSVRTMAFTGHDHGFIDALQVTWADTERGRGSVGTAIRTGQTCVVRSMSSDPRFAPWREAAITHGFGSVASFPLRVAGEIIGTFTIIAAEEDAFGADELALLDEMAADLSFGIEVLRSNARRVAAEEAAQRAVTHDLLTGLPSRIPFLRAVEAGVGSAASGDGLAVLVVYLQNLRELHESLGYDPACTAVLEAAAKLKFAMTPATQLARTENDEFALLLPKADATVTAELARRLQALFEAPVNVGELAVDLRACIGASLFPAHGDEPEMLLRRASIAAREAHQTAGTFFVYRGATERENPARLALAAELRQAIAQRELVLHYQAKVDLRTRAPCGAEALVRWPHPQKGMVPPMQFVPIAEQTGLIRPLTSLVIESAVRQLGAWRGRIELPVAVNLSPRNLHDPRLLEEIDSLLGAWSVPAASLEFEITESALAEEPDKARVVLERLRKLGCKLYIDDFGTGYSSLSYLVSLPVHALKIDRSFVKQMSKAREARAVVSSIVRLAGELGLQTVAEGVETQEDADILRGLGCDQAQGYFFARPVPPEDFKLDL